MIEDEEIIDKHYEYIQQSLKNSFDDPNNKKLAYVTRDDLLDAYGDRLILTIRKCDAIETPAINIDDKVILNRALKISSKSCVDVRLVTDDGESNIKISKPFRIKQEQLSDDEKIKLPIGKRKIKPEVSAEEEVLEICRKRPGRPKRFKREISNDDEESETEEQLFERCTTANILLGTFKNFGTKREIFNDDDEEAEKSWNDDDKSNFDSTFKKYRNLITFFFVTEEPLLEITLPIENLYRFSMYETEGICDLFDIPVRGESIY